MTVDQIADSFTPPKTYVTGYGAPLLYAPDRLHIADAGPVDPPRYNQRPTGEVFFVTPVILCATIYGEEWRDNPAYAMARPIPA